MIGRREVSEDYQHLIGQYVHGRHGVYALYRGDKLYYVGLAKNLRSHLKAHLRNRHRDSWDRFSVYLTIGPKFIREMESLVMRILHPPGNKRRGKFQTCENLKAIFRADIEAEQRADLDEFWQRSKRRTGEEARQRQAKAGAGSIHSTGDDTNGRAQWDSNMGESAA